MREIDEIVLHCTATPYMREVHIDEVRRWHVQGRNWSDVGYHYLITLDGILEKGRELETVGAHVKGRNSTTIGVAYVGGLDPNGKPADTMTCEQDETFEHLVFALQLVLCRPLKLSGHNEHSSKACPGFDVKKKWPKL
jgi:N-acetylmuramoyl-L-alanine amidase